MEEKKENIIDDLQNNKKEEEDNNNIQKLPESFISEIEQNLNKIAKETEADKLIRRILAFKNPFDMLDLPMDTPLNEIQKKYKKIALLIHPDKNPNHPRAVEAFDVLKKSVTKLENEKPRNFYIEVMKKAREQITEEWNNKKQKIENNEKFELEIKKRTQRLLLDFEYNMKRAEEMRLVNERREMVEKMKEEEKLKKELELEQLWEEGRTKRVESWRNFVENKDKKQKKKYTPKPLKPPKINKTS